MAARNQQQEQREVNEGDLPVSMFLTPIAAPARSSIVYPEFGINNFQIRANWINLMSKTLQFCRLPHENPNTYISRFLKNCQNWHVPGVNEDAIKLRLFPYTLRDAALEWLDAEPDRSITTWEELTRKFCNKFVPPAKVAKIRLEIRTFQQRDGESYHEAWNRFKELMRKRIDHREIKQFMDLFELIATTHSMFSSERVVPPKAGRIYELDSSASTNAQIAALTEVELLVKSQTKGAHAVIAGPSCENCGPNHLTKNCTSLGFPEEQINFIQNGYQNVKPFSQTFNPGWRQHPNFRWSDNQQGSSSNNNQPEKKPSLGEMFNQYMQKTNKNAHKGRCQATQWSIQKKIHVKRPDRKDKEIIDEEAGTKAESEQPTNEEDKRKETSTVRAPSPVKAYVPPIPFSQRLQRKKLDKQFAKFVEIFKKLHINILFADAIAQMPSYAKFLKEIWSNKRKLEEHETVCLNKECSAIY
ncbi:uncharacterized protein LOC111377667 [Olea europaea var. sylvestris]|uniref:uncharacterized protein LOC111377667 n=1 Tax=Olea europaea var. sylvestris TaxID=158386 RepID=UPI000C1D4C1E|nr:uncharacterized protein LOC111377667 [Olea europaea var. sylvestris]